MLVLILVAGKGLLHLSTSVYMVDGLASSYHLLTHEALDLSALALCVLGYCFQFALAFFIDCLETTAGPTITYARGILSRLLLLRLIVLE